MEELIKIRKSIKTGNPVVNARDLYVFLEVNKDFSSWLKSKINKYKFKENVDYARVLYDINGKLIPFPQKGESDTQTFERVYKIEYALTLNCAKELAMVQANEKGREARQYFIKVEEQFKALKEIKTANLTYTMSEVAKRLNLRDYCGKVGRNGLYNILYFNKIVDKKNNPLPKYVKSGYFTDKHRVTEEGLKWLNQMFCVEKISDNTELQRQVAELQENQKMLVKGITAVVETMLYNKGGNRTEEQNRLSINHLHDYLEMAKGQKALN